MLVPDAIINIRSIIWELAGANHYTVLVCKTMCNVPLNENCINYEQLLSVYNYLIKIKTNAKQKNIHSNA